MSDLGLNKSSSELHIWDAIKIKLKRELGGATFKSWIVPLVFVSFDAKILRLAAPTKFIADWIEGHYIAKIRAISPEVLVDIQISVRKPTELQLAEKKAEKAIVAAEVTPEKVIDFTEFNSSIASRIDPRFRFDNFVTGDSNKLAFAAAKKVAEKGADAGFNPLFLHSGVGLGKTHLMHAVANYCAEFAPETKVIYLSAEKFLHSFIRSLRDRKSLEFKEELRTADILMIDDFQFICGKKSTQEEFFHTFDALVDDGKQLIISCDRCPAEFEALPERLRSRLLSGLVADIGAADYHLRLQILQAKAAQQLEPIAQDVLEFLAHKISTNIRELEGALNRVTARASLVGGEITVETTKNWVGDLLKIPNKKFGVEQIQEVVAEFYGVSTADIMGKARKAKIAQARQISMYLAKKLTEKSYPEIGRLFGGKDHSTVIHSCRKTEDRILLDEKLAEDVEILRIRVTNNT
jgi:chromosomal replication initiator protein